MRLDFVGAAQQLKKTTSDYLYGISSLPNQWVLVAIRTDTASVSTSVAGAVSIDKISDIGV